MRKDLEPAARPHEERPADLELKRAREELPSWSSSEGGGATCEGGRAGSGGVASRRRGEADGRDRAGRRAGGRRLQACGRQRLQAD